ncbi:MAG: CPBP family glutamic-type intramembrane protease [Candidatus Woesearchaeota archaeon]
MKLSIILALLVPYVAMIFGLYVFHNAWIAFIIYHILILIVMISTKNMGYWKELVKGRNVLIIFLAVLFGICGGLLIYILAPFIGIKSYINPALVALGLSGVSWLVFVFYHSLVNPWFEEAYWRGFLGSKKKSIVLNDIIFAAYHMLVLFLFLEWYWVLLAFVILITTAWLWRQLARKYNGLFIPMLSHMAGDASIMIVVYFLAV